MVEFLGYTLDFHSSSSKGESPLGRKPPISDVHLPPSGSELVEGKLDHGNVR